MRSKSRLESCKSHTRIRLISPFSFTRQSCVIRYNFAVPSGTFHPPRQNPPWFIS
jgi:hypothetical protein